MKALRLIGVVYLLTTALTACDGVPAAPTLVVPPTPVVVPSPSLGKGNVQGKLLVQSEGGKPYRGGVLYLGRVLHADRPDAPPFVSFSANEDTKEFARNENSGEFFFVNVQPGEYALVIDLIAYSYPIEDARTHTLVTVKVEANKATDLGDVYLP